MSKKCSCGKPAIFTGYCEDCEKILKEQLDRELKEEMFYVESDRHAIFSENE
jgi:hypothetical protein